MSRASTLLILFLLFAGMSVEAAAQNRGGRAGGRPGGGPPTKVSGTVLGADTGEALTAATVAVLLDDLPAEHPRRELVDRHLRSLARPVDREEA